MTILSRLDVIRLLTLSNLLIFSATSEAPQVPPIAEQMAKTYGLDSFGQVEGIRYTFNLEFPGVKRSETWEWQPKTDTVSYEGKDKEGKTVKVTYQRSELSSQSDAVKKQIDPAFVNDHYVLLFPLHVAWDTWATVIDEGMHEMPISKKAARRVIVQYPSRGGYSPGDTWEFYVGKDKQLEEFIFHRAGSDYPRL